MAGVKNVHPDIIWTKTKYVNRLIRIVKRIIPKMVHAQAAMMDLLLLKILVYLRPSSLHMIFIAENFRVTNVFNAQTDIFLTKNINVL